MVADFLRGQPPVNCYEYVGAFLLQMLFSEVCWRGGCLVWWGASPLLALNLDSYFLVRTWSLPDHTVHSESQLVLDLNAYKS